MICFAGRVTSFWYVANCFYIQYLIVAIKRFKITFPIQWWCLEINRLLFRPPSEGGWSRETRIADKEASTTWYVEYMWWRRETLLRNSSSSENTTAYAWRQTKFNSTWLNTLMKMVDEISAVVCLTHEISSRYL